MTLRSILPVAAAIALAGLPDGQAVAQTHRGGRRGAQPRDEKAAGATTPSVPTEAQPDRVVEVRVADEGSEPTEIVLKTGQRVRLVFTRTTDNTCAKTLVIDELLVWNELALGKPFSVNFTTRRPGEFPYTCPTGKVKGIIKVEGASSVIAATAAVGLASPDSIPLPGGPPVGVDYLAYDAATGRVWVPAGNTGRIDVIDTRTRKLESIEGVATRRHGDRVVGASSATVGDGVVYVGNRADSTVCAFDARTLARQGCVTLASTPDGLAYVATTKEVWVTTPGVKSVVMIDTKDPGHPRLSGTITLEGAPEGYAVDASRGLFYTNLEDKDRTLVVDVEKRKVVAVWKSGCGEKGPRGLALDAEHRQLFVACTDRLETMDAANDGAVLSDLGTGAGVDNIDLLPSRRLVYVASDKEARLTVAAVGENGSLSRAWTSPTAEGCRTVLVDRSGTAYVPDSAGGRLVVVRPPPN